jgi:hypothetical protein
LKDEVAFTFAMQHKVPLNSVCNWTMDLGATKHMTLYEVAFGTYEVVFPCNMRLGDDIVAKAIGMESIVIGVETKNIRNEVRITYVFHMPKLQANLFSVSKLLSNGLNVQFHVMVAIVRRKGSLYQMTFTEVCEVDATNFVHHVWEAIRWSFGIADSNI